MIRQNVFIINFKSLYEILDEIKDNLSFKIIKIVNEEDFIISADLDIKNSLIIFKSNHKPPANKSITDKNLLSFDDLPLPVSKILELINIQLLKLKFNHQSKINIKGYELNLNSKFFSKDDVTLKLTEKEIEIILYLDAKKFKHKIADLQKNIWRYAPDLETHTVETHIYRLRKKINEKFSDKNFIKSHNEGYFIE